jgi:hypothetical protein|tara:strand:+ start:1602 stop:1808 length:207 start_codon:yes stop_codon:yes gene_type:complete
MAKRGKNTYVPSIIIDEIKDIQREDEVDSQSEAFKKMVKYAQVGRETKRLMRLDWSKANKKKKGGLLF